MVDLALVAIAMVNGWTLRKDYESNYQRWKEVSRCDCTLLQYVHRFVLIRLDVILVTVITRLVSQNM